MNVESLIALGFTRNEAIVYTQIVQAGSCNAKFLIKQTTLHKKIVYDNLERLQDKGLISTVIADGVHMYFLENPNALIEYFEKQEAKVLEQKKKAVLLSTEIASMKRKHPVEQQTYMLIGVAGVKQLMLQWLHSKQSSISFGAPKESVDIMGEHYWHNYNLKQKELGIKGKLLFNSSLKDWALKGMHPANEIRFLPDILDPLTQTIVFGETVAIIVWSPKPVVTVIKDPFVAQSYENFFSILWKQAKEK